MIKLVICSSGTGSNLRAIFNAIEHKILIATIECVIINKECDSIEFCKNNNINYEYVPYNNKSTMTREEYDSNLISIISKYNPYLIVLAGWMHIVSGKFINSFSHIINLHPALPNSFTGINCIRKAYDKFQTGSIKYTGAMVHKVIEEIDRGEVLTTVKVPIYGEDSLDDLGNRVKLYEKGILIEAIQQYITRYNSELISDKKMYIGKVRQVEDIGYNLLLLKASNRISAYDRHLCDIDKKGVILNKISEYWFSNTRHIIENHYLYSKGPYMVVKKCVPIKLEIVVRAYMTGTSNTSIWTHYKNGSRHIYGIQFRDGYVKNEKLDNIIITPTTKGKTDRPITKAEICRDYLTEAEYDYIYNKALDLFRYGQKVALEKGLILVDTKYEFGYYNNKIILIDELHTCDSSRYWLSGTYTNTQEQGMEPDKYDKDVIRDWVKNNCDPYNTEIGIPDIPIEVIDNVSMVYEKYYNILTGKCLQEEDFRNNTKLYVMKYFFSTINKKVVVIFAGSIKDKSHIDKIELFLKSHNLYSEIYYCSAHKETKRLMGILDNYENSDKQVIYVTCAGRSNALSGVVASNSRFPVIACPVFKDKIDMSVNINSTLQCPSKVPVMAILEPENVALSIKKIWGSNN